MGVVNMIMRRVCVVLLSSAIFGCAGSEPAQIDPADDVTVPAAIETRPVEAAATIAFTSA